jgi:hypothetical protein
MLPIYQPRESKHFDYTYFGHGPFLGVELELDVSKPTDTLKLRQTIAEILDKEDLKNHYFLEIDTTLKNGVEVIFHPHSLEELQLFLKTSFAPVLEELKSKTELEEDSPYAMFHVHVSKSFFGDSLETQHKNIAKLWYFFSRYPMELLQGVGQTKLALFTKIYDYNLTQAAAVAKVNTEYTTHPAWSRYQAINVNNEKTVEFRFFRATLDLSTMLFFINLCYYFATRAVTASWEECADWSQFFKDASPELCDQLTQALDSKPLFKNPFKNYLIDSSK